MRSRVPALAAVALIVTTLAALPSCAPSTPATAREDAGTLDVVGGTLVDGTGRAPLPGATMVIRAGRVTEVTAGGVAGLRAGTERIDARGRWIVPGLIDMHVHYQPGWMDALFLRHGVTTVRDVGSGLNSILELREDSRAPGVGRPRIFACGPLIDGPRPRHGTGISVSVETAAEARAAARRLLERGVDCLKTYEQLTPPLVEAVVREAGGTHVPVTAHLRDTSAVQALEIGVRGLEHAFGFDACDETVVAQVVRRVVERGAYVVPTLAITEQGSDTSNPYVVPGASLHRELELPVEAGLSTSEALAAATRTAAAFLGQTRTLGTLEVGKTADLVVLGADPLASIGAIRQVEVVIRDGRVVWRR